MTFKGIYILECWGENNRGKTLKHCPICESYDLMPMTICDQCGYDDKSSEISDKDKLFSFLSKIKKSKNWAEEVRIKKRVNDIQINKHGVQIRKGLRSGVFLPQVATENNWDLDTFMSVLCQQKAGLPDDCWKDKRMYANRSPSR